MKNSVLTRRTLRCSFKIALGFFIARSVGSGLHCSLGIAELPFLDHLLDWWERIFRDAGPELDEEDHARRGRPSLGEAGHVGDPPLRATTFRGPSKPKSPLSASLLRTRSMGFSGECGKVVRREGRLGLGKTCSTASNSPRPPSWRPAQGLLQEDKGVTTPKGGRS